MEKIKFKNIKKILSVLIVLIIAGFVLTSFVKINLAKNSWNFYNSDFEWVKSNTDKNDIFLSGSQCISFNIGRQTFAPVIDNLGKVDYVLVNQDFKLDGRVRLNDDIIAGLGNEELVYDNEETETKIYKIKR